ncbi:MULTISPECIES: class IIb bacteriocin, lactobin A/cerein 7B family [Lacticaseibacillus]|uniref:Bacteriocin leader domain-containing protein n=2 Tax=Lacticaseibacillus TaxID=2759736 RepID=A0AAN1F078_LACCA|nr:MULTISPECIES: class IIb bacteriocin, lactobin A/cerein 7B family [Lacticaseibacillus]ARY92337.1 bacteriocin leader domain-containing protein [Lacticaseibacillus casei]KAB1971381.1 class IIb bacteriocin, lactobin A/cerein 7B family [Lacticaseibacillus casei]WLV80240.1 class IIb bacteriocin, lactobin A/cerein 7B family [Lacticaseibacillus sp. NCIMB 15473]WNX24200.1 class IIb bacteriocin, lactobin A/cerein 7B family [Lacticaseibacillus casei]WNX26974.1 class IIb bacteriocin, lactobin A/cerein 
MTNLKDSELCQINGGFAPIVIPVATILGILATDAFNHADQLIDGFKKGWERP